MSIVGISWVLWRVFSTVGDILSTVGVTMSTIGVIEYCGSVQYRGGISWVPWRVFSIVGGNLLLFEYPMVLMISPTVLMIFPHMHHDIPPWYWTPHGPQDTSPHLSWYLPMVLKISPDGTHDIPPQYLWYPPWYSWYPPTVLMISPMVLMISPPYWTPPWYCTHFIRYDLLNWRSWKIQTWYDDRHAVHQCFCTTFDSWYLDLTSSILSKLDVHFYRILLISQYFLQFKSTIVSWNLVQ